MPTEIASLGIEVNSKQVKQAEKELGRLERQSGKTEKATSKFSKATAMLTSKMGALVTVAGAYALLRQTKETIEFADAIAKTADKLGVSTDALQEYRFAAERSGVAQTALDMGLQRFSRRLGEADQGMGELKDTLEQLNISTRDSNGLLKTSEQVMVEYADAIQAAEGDQEKLRLAFKAFDSEGAAMVNMLRNGSAGLEELRQKARDAGVVIDEELIRKAEVMNDKWDTLVQTIGTNLKSAILSVAGPLMGVYTDAERLVKVQREYKEVLDEIKRVEEERGNQPAIQAKLQQRRIELQKEWAELSDKIITDTREKERKAAEEAAADAKRTAEAKKEAIYAEQDAMLTATAFKQAHQEEVRQQELEGIEEHGHAIRMSRALAQLQLEEQERTHQEAMKEITIGALDNLSQLMRGQSKKLFELGKMASLATATIKGLEAVQSAYAAGNKIGGPILGAAYAATAFGVQAQNVQKIRKQKFVARATGGPVSEGDRVLVGERGPEVIEMGGKGNVINNNSLGGNKTANVTFVMPADEQIKNVIRNNRALLFNVITAAMNEEGVKFS